MGFRTAMFGGFQCDLSVMGRLGPLYEAGQPMGLCGRWDSSVRKNTVLLDLEW